MADSGSVRRTRTSGVRTLESLVDLYFARGYEALRVDLARQFATGAIDRFYWHSEEGKSAYRTDVGQSQHLDFKSFSPPPLWQAPYAISLAHFRRPERGSFSHFIYHGTEEILLPINGAIQYSFFHSRGGEPAKLKALPRPLSGSSIIRVNPQVPHSTAAVTEDAAAWMIFRDAANASARLVRSGTSLVSSKGRRGKGREQNQHSEGQRLVSQRDLEGPDAFRYGLIAWNIAELVRNARLRSALSLEQLGALVGMDRTSLSRLERADLNIRLDRLFAICNELDLDIANAIEGGLWDYDTEDLPRFGRDSEIRPLLLKPRSGHLLETSVFDLKKGHKKRINVLCRAKYSSWIALRGRLIVDVHPKEDERRKSLIVNQRSVLHFRRSTPGDCIVPRSPEMLVDLQAVEDSRFLIVTCDDGCGR